jgi:hypothetical protein
MTAGYDAMRGTDQRFTDALSGSDGTSDPSVLMPVLDVYPDALSAPMPVDLVPVLVPLPIPTVGQPGVRAEPVLGPAGRATPGRTPPAQRGTQSRQPAQRQPVRQPTPTQAFAAGPLARRPAQSRQPPPASAPRYVPPAQPTGPTFSWQGRQVSAGDVAAMFRNSLSQSGQVDRQSFQATHPQSHGSASPSAVAPAAPMASQYSPMRDARNAAQARRQFRPPTSSKRKSSSWAVIVFFFVILFATGIGQKIIDFITELLNR